MNEETATIEGKSNTGELIHAPDGGDPREAKPEGLKERFVEVYQDDAGEWRWRRKAANGEIVADSGEGYETEGGASFAAAREFPTDSIFQSQPVDVTTWRKKPVEIKAVQWTGDNLDEVRLLIPAADAVLRIDTLEGAMTAQVGDFIICGVKGELYPCKPDIFKETYDLVG